MSNEEYLNRAADIRKRIDEELESSGLFGLPKISKYSNIAKYENDLAQLKAEYLEGVTDGDYREHGIF